MYSVFTIRDAEQKPVFVGVTKIKVERRMQQIMSYSKSKTSRNYTMALSEWLRKQHSELKHISYRVEAVYENQFDASNAKMHFIEANPGLLNR